MYIDCVVKVNVSVEGQILLQYVRTDLVSSCQYLCGEYSTVGRLGGLGLYTCVSLVGYAREAAW